MASMLLVGIKSWRILNVHMRRGHIETTTNGQSVAIWSPELLKKVFDAWEGYERDIRRQEEDYEYRIKRMPDTLRSEEQERRISDLKRDSDNWICVLVHKWLIDNSTRLQVELGRKDSPHTLNIWVK